MQADELRKYDKETLVQYIVQNLIPSGLKFELDRIQHRLKFDPLSAESAAILEEMKKIQNPKTLEGMNKWNELWKRYQNIQKKIDKLLEIQLGEKL
ncbi:MAG TPA: hypothetical protein PKY59_07680 [Pyrinomonadaceae bacterium]|nr:hypothetical protein [Pyrinomonadaceae bacterium]